MKSIYDRIFDIIVEQMGGALKIPMDQLKGQHRLLEDIGMDSLDMVELVMEVEEEFDFAISEEVAQKFLIVKDIATFVHSIFPDLTLGSSRDS